MVRLVIVQNEVRGKFAQMRGVDEDVNEEEWRREGYYNSAGVVAPLMLGTVASCAGNIMCISATKRA